MVPGVLPYPVRYIPIPENETVHPPIANFTLSRGNITANISTVLLPRQTLGVSSHSSFLIYYLLFATVAFAVLVLAYYYSSGVPIPTRVMVSLGERRVEPIITAIYEYTGIKKVLRRYYLRLRNMIGCTTCTPREMAMMSRDKRIYMFAEVYEDVVYGSKNRMDVDNVISMIDKTIGGVKD